MEKEVKAAVNELQKTFEAFKIENDEKLKAKADVVTTEKVDRINTEISNLQAAVDQANAKIAAAALGGGNSVKTDPKQVSAFIDHMRSGAVHASLNKGTASEGGYLAPTEWDRTITDQLVQVSAMRSIASVQTISGTSFKKLFNKRGTASGWVGETAARPETTAPTFGELTYSTGEIYANISATQTLLEDAEVDLESWIAGEVETKFAYEEGVAFLSGDGSNKPTGILTYVTGAANAAAHPYGAVLATNAGHASLLTADGIIKVVHALPSEFTKDARFVMNRNTQKEARLLKDTTNNYLWQPSYAAGAPATLAGYAITEMAAMPDIAANTLPILFGDFKKGYLVVDRKGTTLLRDPYTNKPYVMFYVTKRVGGGLLNPEAIKALKIAA